LWATNGTLAEPEEKLTDAFVPCPTPFTVEKEPSAPAGKLAPLKVKFSEELKLDGFRYWSTRANPTVYATPTCGDPVPVRRYALSPPAEIVSDSPAPPGEVELCVPSATLSVADSALWAISVAVA